MTEPSDITAPKDPADYRPRPMLGVTFWAMIAFGVICVLAGVAIAQFGPRLFSHKPPGHAAEAPLPSEPAPAAAAAVSGSPALSVAPESASPDVAKLNARVAILETRQAHAAEAAAAVLATAAVAEASQGSGPFAEELATLRASSPPSPELETLARLAAGGAPSRAALASSFPDYAARAASAARAPGEKAGLGDRIAYALSKIVSLRRVDDVSGDGPDALLARAERLVDDGDLDRAFRQLDRLPPASRDALAPWRARAERRAEIDRAAQALMARALAELAAQQRTGA